MTTSTNHRLLSVLTRRPLTRIRRDTARDRSLPRKTNNGVGIPLGLPPAALRLVVAGIPATVPATVPRQGGPLPTPCRLSRHASGLYAQAASFACPSVLRNPSPGVVRYSNVIDSTSRATKRVPPYATTAAPTGVSPTTCHSDSSFSRLAPTGRLQLRPTSYKDGAHQSVSAGCDMHFDLGGVRHAAGVFSTKGIQPRSPRLN